MVFLSVFLVSLTSLCYEVLLTRFFSFWQWNHLSFMVISIVMFGFGASGTVLSLVEARQAGFSRAALDSGHLPLLLLLCSLAMSGSFLLVKHIPLDYYRMPLEWRQALYLLSTFLVLLVPFFFAGAVVSLSFAALPQRSGWLYFASMSGSAAGALLPAALLPLLGEGRIVLACALLLLLLPLAWSSQRLPLAEARRVLAATLLLGASTAAVLARGGQLLEVQPSEYKLLAQARQFPDTRVTESRNTLRARLDRLESPYIRFAPGLSLKYRGELPRRSFLVQDADELYVLFDLDDPQALEFCRYSHSFAGYLSAPQQGIDKVLLLLQAGGLSLPCAVSAGAAAITLVLEHPRTAAAYRDRYAGGRVAVVSRSARGYLARSTERYDRIQLEAWGPSIAGLASLNQEHLLTVESLASCLEHLTPSGLLILSRRLLLPPSDCLRLFAAAWAAVDGLGAERPGEHIFLLRGWDSYTLLVARSALDQGSISRIRQFCRERNFDPVFYSGITEEEANRFNAFAEPFHYREIQRLYGALQAGRAAGYLRSYYLDVAPARDDRPFHSRFVRWLSIGALYRSSGSRLYSLLLSGETVLLAVLAISLVLGLLLLLLPWLAGGRARRRQRPAARSGAAALLCFVSGGAGFMFLEMALLQHYTFLFASPVLAFTLVLTGLLILSGVGGAVSSRWRSRELLLVLALLIVVLTALQFLMQPAGHALLGRSPALQAAGLLLLLIPAGLPAGMPFPMGLRLLVPDARARAYGWAANGIASVLASILALPLAMSWGISRLLLAAACCYALFLVVCLCRFSRPAGRRE